MAATRQRVVILANAPRALQELCGVGCLERLLRILLRLGCEEVLIVSTTPEEIRRALEPRSWARQGLTTRVLARKKFQPEADARLLVLPGDFYFDARLIKALWESPHDAALVDSAPPDFVRPLLADGFEFGAVVVSGSDFAEARSRKDLASIDAATVPAYVRGMRREVRPVFFPAPPPESRGQAERVILDTAQNGTLDLPAILHAPIESWIVRRLCRTNITPNQITLFGFAVALAATFLFAAGHLWPGIVLALLLGVVDGLDGKQARVKIETTAAGNWEHVLDFFVEASWWAALAFWFERSGQLPHAWILFGVIMAADVVDRLAKKAAHRRIERLLDDHSSFDRFVRRIGARRNIYIVILLFGLIVGQPAAAFRFCALWGAMTAAVHTVRAFMLTLR